jgi:Ca2+-binding RTX toxin-like protein
MGEATIMKIKGKLADFRDEPNGVSIDRFGEEPVAVVSGSSQGYLELTNILNIRGTRFSDLIDGDPSKNRLWGDGGDDHLFGQSGRDKLYGNEGDDHIHAGLGNDLMRGGRGGDIFDLRSFFDMSWGTNDLVNGGDDKIRDFEKGEDRIQLDYAVDDRIEGLFFGLSFREMFESLDSNGDGVLDKRDDHVTGDRRSLTLDYNAPLAGADMGESVYGARAHSPDIEATVKIVGVSELTPQDFVA